MDTIFKMVVLTWLLTAIPYHANAAAMNKSTSPYTNSTQPSNGDCNLSLQQCVIIHGHNNDCYNDEHQQVKDCASICNPEEGDDVADERCQWFCPAFTYTGKECDDSMLTGHEINPETIKTLKLSGANTNAVTVVAVIAVFAFLMSGVALVVHCHPHIQSRRNNIVECQVTSEEITGSSLKEPTSFDNTKCKWATKLGSLKMKVDGRIFNLQTAVMDGDNCEEFTKLPDKLVDLVKAISSKGGVSSAMLYQSPSDSKELLVVGVGADKKVQEKLQAAVSEHFPDFTIFTDAINHHSEHTKNYSGRAFTAVKQILQGDTKRFVDVRKAICELVLEGESIAANGNTDARYYAFLPAHFVLEEPDMKRLLAENVHPGELNRIQENTAGKSVHSRCELAMLHPWKSVSLRSNDAMFAYRQYQQGVKKGPEHFSSFYNDSYLLEIEKGYLDQRKDNIISFEDLEEAMRIRQDGEVLDEVLPVRHAAQLVNMGVRHVRVEVGPSHGYMVWGIFPLQKEKDATPVDDRPQLHHIQFVLESWPLMEGHSGSIVYVIDADNGHRYRFGMLVGLARRHHNGGQDIYQAIVLRQAIDELEDSFSHRVQNLKPLVSSASRKPTKEQPKVILRRVSSDEDPQSGNRHSLDINGYHCERPKVLLDTGLKKPVQARDSP